jgi:hypothetical protein
MNRGFAAGVENLTTTTGQLTRTDTAATEEFLNQVWIVVANSTQKFVPSNVALLNETLNQTLEELVSASYDYADDNNNVTALGVMTNATNAFVLDFWNSIMDSYGFEPPENDTTTALEVVGPSEEKAEAALQTAQLIVSLSTHAGIY